MQIGNYFTLTNESLFVMAGPCVLESGEINDQICETVKNFCDKLGINYIFKASFDKANRTSVSSFRGRGLEEGLKELERIKNRYNVPVITDVHESYQPKIVASVVDLLQIPAFLCRQTDLIVACAETGKPTNIKKAQFLSAEDMKNVVTKFESTGNKNIMLCERGTMFGYNNLVVDFRNVTDMAKIGYPVVMDATHATQRPGGQGSASGGNPEYAPNLAKAAYIFGARGFFFEVHPEPCKAKSDAATMLKLDEFGSVLRDLHDLDRWYRGHKEK